MLTHFFHQTIGYAIRLVVTVCHKASGQVTILDSLSVMVLGIMHGYDTFAYHNRFNITMIEEGGKIIIVLVQPE